MIKLKFVTGTVLIYILYWKGCPVWIVPFGRADMKGKKVILFLKNSHCSCAVLNYTVQEQD
jgi:hypothetical protein